MFAVQRALVNNVSVIVADLENNIGYVSSVGGTYGVSVTVAYPYVKISLGSNTARTNPYILFK